MGQKVNPIGFRLGLTQTWRSRWFAKGKKFAEFVEEDLKIRRFVRKSLQRAAISRIEIERANKSLSIEIFTARPGIVIGKAGTEVDTLKNNLEKMLKKEVQISVKEIRRPELDAYLLAENVAEQLVGRVPFRRAMKRAVSAAMKAGAKGVKIATAGRLGGYEMARSEWYREGRVPLHTLRADIDYGYAKARTTFGSIGVKVWLYRGDLLPGVTKEEEKVALRKKLEEIQAAKAAERKIEEADLKKMEEAAQEGTESGIEGREEERKEKEQTAGKEKGREKKAEAEEPNKSAKRAKTAKKEEVKKSKKKSSTKKETKAKETKKKTTKKIGSKKEEPKSDTKKKDSTKKEEK